MSCCTACCVVFNCVATDCCVASSFEEAFQPNAKPPMAIKPRTMIAGSVQAGDSVRVSTILSSDIVDLSPHPNLGKCRVHRHVIKRLHARSQREKTKGCGK